MSAVDPECHSCVVLKKHLHLARRPGEISSIHSLLVPDLPDPSVPVVPLGLVGPA